jgi:hypothetical protein
MRSRIAILLIAAAFACESDGDIHLPQGKYSGYFTRSTVNEDGTPSKVTLIFTGNTFSGSGDTPKYPAICEGTYSIDGDKITFTNTCPWTAEFDWTLILGGEYVINVDGDQVKFFRDYNGIQSDTYVLNRDN